MVLNLKDRGVNKIAIEVSNFKAKNFRTGFENPYSRIRHMMIT